MAEQGFVEMSGSFPQSKFVKSKAVPIQAMEVLGGEDI
jgi:hypothetical protein